MLEKLRLFLVVLEEGSLRRAADRLRISQSAITRQMQSLELELGGRVLERTSAGVRSTNGGQPSLGVTFGVDRFRRRRSTSRRAERIALALSPVPDPRAGPR